MSSTTVRRPARPQCPPTRVAADRPQRIEGIEDQHRYTAPVDRAFPMLAITRDTIVLLGFALVALLLRLWALGDRAMHHDESLHGVYSWYLMGRAGPEYHYDPMMHGPLQFHMIGMFYSFLGSSPFVARLWSASCGTALVLCPWLIRRQLGRTATYALMTIFCLSPIILYFSRFAREDMQFGLFTFLTVVGLVRYVADRQDEAIDYWRWLYLVAAAFGLSYAAKESAYLNAAMLLGFLGIWLAGELLPGHLGTRMSGSRRVVRETERGRTERGGREGAVPIPLWLPALAVLGLVVLGAAIKVLSGSGLGALFVVVAVPGLYLLYLLFTTERHGLLIDTLRGTPFVAWGFSVAIVAVLFVLFYWPINDPISWGFVPGAHTVPTTLEVAGKPAQPFTYSTDGIFGGLGYWIAQTPVARGGQPWYYYLLIIPLYEWTVVLFGLIGGVYLLLRQRASFFAMLILYWNVATLGIYCWTTEKMPWNSVHVVIPLAVLAAIGIARGLANLKPTVRYLTIGGVAITGLASIHNAYTLSYLNGANPVELMVYVQTHQDVPKIYDELGRLQAVIAAQAPGGDKRLHLVVDAADEWPWVYYLRDPNRWAVDNYPSKPDGYANAKQPVLLVDSGNYPLVSQKLAGQYAAFREVLRWWGPEEYKTYAERHYTYQFDAQGHTVPLSKSQQDAQGNPALLPKLDRLKYFLHDLISPTTWANVGQWETVRRPFSPSAWQGDSNQLIFYFLVRRDLAPHLSQALQQQADPVFYKLTKPRVATGSFGTTAAAGAPLRSSGPVATNAQGDVFVVDPVGNAVHEFGPNGTPMRTWGISGTKAGQFQFELGGAGGQTSGIAVGPSGNVYVSDTWNHRIQEFSPTGGYLRSWGRPTPAKDQGRALADEFYGPRGIAVGPDSTVYVADTGNERVQIFDANGRYLSTIGGPGSGIGQFHEPSSVAVDRQGRAFVADYWNQRVQIFGKGNRQIGMIPIATWQAGSYDEPSIAVDGSGRVYVPDASGSRVLVYSAAGAPVSAWGTSADGTTQLARPLSVAVGPDGQILVSDNGLNRVVRFAAS